MSGPFCVGAVGLPPLGEGAREVVAAAGIPGAQAAGERFPM
ncbi:hypothetical protein BLA24064_00415 [Burkholderia latens]|uniref:Uncharacterized protein n=1 Tax=Burkholderia latens TaxID=488446 RepID=A0A6P2H8B7_9BURK|nr:hypothetical protein BLA24064_00415 [Burkholderia latens]